jgi:hypothetical protein
MFEYRLSVVGSVAPPGTAWDAEGLRGNEATENKLMVLVQTRARKWQSGRVLHKRTLPEVRASGFGLRASGFGFRVSGFGFRVSGFGFRVSGFGFRVSGFGFRVSGFGFRVGTCGALAGCSWSCVFFRGGGRGSKGLKPGSRSPKPGSRKPAARVHAPLETSWAHCWACQ